MPKFMISDSENTLQILFRELLYRLRKKLSNSARCTEFIDGLRRDSIRGTCVADEGEVRLLSNALGEGTIKRREIPKKLGISYRQCIKEGIFKKIKKTRKVGIYDRISVSLFKRNKI